MYCFYPLLRRGLRVETTFLRLKECVERDDGIDCPIAKIKDKSIK